MGVQSWGWLSVCLAPASFGSCALILHKRHVDLFCGQWAATQVSEIDVLDTSFRKKLLKKHSLEGELADRKMSWEDAAKCEARSQQHCHNSQKVERARGPISG